MPEQIDVQTAQGKPDPRQAWLLRVLGVPLATPPGPTPAKTLPQWREAIEAVGEDIATLQAKMRDIGHPVLTRVADQGLGPFTKNLQVGLHVALLEFDGGGAGRDQARAKAEGLIADFRRFLDSNPVVPLLDRNPFGVALNMQARLTTALASIEATLRA
jgi:hypothetical protein